MNPPVIDAAERLPGSRLPTRHGIRDDRTRCSRIANPFDVRAATQLSVIVIPIALSLVGCGPVPRAPVSEVAETASSVAIERSPSVAASSEQIIDQPGDDERLDGQLTNALRSETQSTQEIREEPEMSYRLWIPTSAGPILVGLELLLDGQPLKKVFEEKVKRIREKLPKNPSWEVLLNHVADNPAVFGEASARVRGQKKTLIKRFDRNKNDTVDGGELVRFLFRESNFADAFRLFGTDAFRWSNRTNSALFIAIDRDGNRKLDKQEVANASAAMLRQIDRNADECIDWGELSDRSQREQTPWQSGRSNRQGNVAMDLTGFVNWSNLSYAMGGMLKTPPLLGQENPVSLIDVDQDRWVTAEEAEKILDVLPSIRLVIHFDAPRGTPAVDARLARTGIDRTAQGPSNRHTITLSGSDDEVWISAPSLQLGIIAHDLPPIQNRIPREAFEMLDVNLDGGLDESEIPEAAKDQIQFDLLDRDEDGSLSFKEINQAPQNPGSIWNVQVRARAAEFPDGLFAWLDRNHDHFLSTREIRSAPQRLTSLVAEAAAIKPADLPETVLLQFGRGEPAQDMTHFQFRRAPDNPPDQRPEWAIQMDANRDGDVSQNEFPGPIGSFSDLDLDRDGFLSAEELGASLGDQPTR